MHEPQPAALARLVALVAGVGSVLARATWTGDYALIRFAVTGAEG